MYYIVGKTYHFLKIGGIFVARDHTYYVRDVITILYCFGSHAKLLPANPISTFSPAGGVILNCCKNVAKRVTSSGFAIVSPKHTRLPAENGNHPGGVGVSFLSSSKYLVGSNTSGLLQRSSLMCMLWWLMMIVVPFLISNFPVRIKNILQ